MLAKMEDAPVDGGGERDWFPNVLGVVAIVLWSSTVGFSRLVMEDLGIARAVACQYLLAGFLLCAIEFARSRSLRRLREIPPTYLIVCGLLFVAYMACLFGGLGLAKDRRQAIEVGLLNYLWPALVVVFSVPILRYRARWALLAPGAAMGIAGAGIALAAGSQTSLSLADFFAGIRSSPLPYLLGLTGGILWGLYSNFVRRLSKPDAAAGTPLFALASGGLFALLIPLSDHSPTWSGLAALGVAYLGVLPGAIGYVFWETGMRRGNVVLLGSLSFFTPVLSTLISCALLKVWFGPDLLVGCCLVVAGAWVCKLSVKTSLRE
ncbi:MAG: aromatic amino acid DMT transporter YddG [Planctomycetota bacterium]